MPNILSLPIDTGMIFKVGATLNRLSDHNRSAISVTMDRIENRKRMADGTMRTFVVATKRQWKASWEDLPRDDNQTADGFWGSIALINFYQTTLGSFELVVTDGNNETETALVMFDSFDFKLSKRSLYTDFYDIDLSVVEV